MNARDFMEETPEEERRRIWIELGIVLALGILPYYLFFVAPFTPPGGIAEEALSRIVQSLPVVLVPLYFMWRSERIWEHFGLGRNADGTGIGISIAAMIVGTVLTAYIATAFDRLWPMTPDQRAMLKAVLPFPSNVVDWLWTIPAILISVAAEEIVVRGFLTVRLYDQTYSKPIAVLVPALLFGGYHYYQGISSCIAITLWGVFYGAMMLSTKRLKSLILAHFLSNVIFTVWNHYGT